MQIPTENPHTSTCGGSQSRMRRKSHHALKNNEKSFCTFEFLEGRQLFSASPVRTQASDIKIEQIPWNGKIVSVVDDSYYIRMNQTQTGRDALDYRHQAPIIPKNWISKEIGFGFYSLSAPGTTIAQVQSWAKTARVAYAEPNFVSTASALAFSGTPNDPQFSALWGLASIKAPLAWQTTVGSKSPVVAVLDTGVDFTHPDLANNLWKNPREIPGDNKDNDGNGYIDDIYGWNVISQDKNVLDTNGHGTHVSGTIGAVGNNAIGVVGVNWSTQIMTVNMNSIQGTGVLGEMPQAFQYVIRQKQMGVNVVAINASFGMPVFSQALFSMIEIAGKLGITVICAAGNNSTNTDLIPNYPSGFDLPNVISVAAIDQTNQLATFSNYGKQTVDLAAPGVSILSTWPTQLPAPTGGVVGYNTISGTSMAAPHVTGTVALLKSLLPSASVADIRDAILGSTRIVVGLNAAVATSGTLNASAAIARLLAPPVITVSNNELIEGNGSFNSLSFTITLSRATVSGARVNYQTADGTATVASGDYMFTKGQALIQPWQTSAVVRVMIKGDKIYEQDEYFSLGISSPLGGTIGKSKGIGIIFNDDAYPMTTRAMASIASVGGSAVGSSSTSQPAVSSRVPQATSGISAANRFINSTNATSLSIWSAVPMVDFSVKKSVTSAGNRLSNPLAVSSATWANSGIAVPV